MNLEVRSRIDPLIQTAIILFERQLLSNPNMGFLSIFTTFGISAGSVGFNTLVYVVHFRQKEKRTKIDSFFFHPD
jgi:hypothetical protein